MTTTADSPIAPAHHDVMERLASVLEALEGRNRLVDELKARTPIYVREHGNAASASTVTLTSLTSQPEIIEAIIASAPAAATIYLAEVQIFLPSAGVYTIAPLELFLNPSDLRQMVAASAGAISLTLLGHQLPQWGTASVR